MNDLALLIITGTIVMLIFSGAYIMLSIATNKKIIDSQRKTIEEIQKSEARYKALFENSIAGMMKFNPETWEIIEVNSSLRVMFRNATPGELRQIFKGIDESLSNRIRDSFMDKGSISECEISLVNDGNKEQWFLFSGKKDTADGMAHAVVLDITEKKKLEQAYVRAQKMEAVSLLTGSIAHDLQNILAPISLSVNLLNKKIKTPRIKKILKATKESANNGVKLIKNILAMSRGVRTEGKRINIVHFVDAVINNFNHPRGISIRYIQIPKKMHVFVAGNENQLRQLFQNLLLNARDAVPKKGGEIKIIIEKSVKEEEFKELGIALSPAGFIKITITDNGKGISQEYIDKIFEPFFTTKEFGRGTGLGLSLVSEIVKNHDGYIAVSSAPAEGTSFKIYLPVKSVKE